MCSFVRNISISISISISIDLHVLLFLVPDREQLLEERGEKRIP